MIDRATLVAAAPGLALVAVLTAIAYAATLVLPDVFGAVTIGLFLGIIVANVRPVSLTEPGARSAKAWFLPLGILLLGARLSVADILSTGLGAILVLVVDIVLVLVVTLGIGRALGLSRQLAALIGVGTSICGNTAIAATAPVIKAPERDVSFAVATITLFGTAAVVVYPLIGHALGMSDNLFGHWVGAAVNDTSQVTATAFGYSVEAGETATIVKLTRNTLMVPVIFSVGMWFAARESRSAGSRGTPRLARVSAQGRPTVPARFPRPCPRQLGRLHPRRAGHVAHARLTGAHRHGPGRCRADHADRCPASDRTRTVRPGTRGSGDAGGREPRALRGHRYPLKPWSGSVRWKIRSTTPWGCSSMAVATGARSRMMAS